MALVGKDSKLQPLIGSSQKYYETVGHYRKRLTREISNVPGNDKNTLVNYRNFPISASVIFAGSFANPAQGNIPEGIFQPAQVDLANYIASELDEILMSEDSNNLIIE